MVTMLNEVDVGRRCPPTDGVHQQATTVLFYVNICKQEEQEEEGEEGGAGVG